MKGKLLLLSLAALGAVGVLALHSQESTPGGQALIRVRVPANATVTIDTVGTRQRGFDRLFITPPLEAGKTFTYEIEASWLENGQPRKFNLTAKVKAGQQTSLDFF